MILRRTRAGRASRLLLRRRFNSSGLIPSLDWKYLDLREEPGTGSDCDFAGTVVDVGEKVAEIKIGERVAGMVQGGSNTQHGAFNEHVKTDARLVWKVPAAFDFGEAAALGGVGVGEVSLRDISVQSHH